MIQDIQRKADEKVVITGQKKGNKYTMHINENIVIGLFKDSVIKIVLEERLQKQVKILEKIQKEMENYVLPIKERLKNDCKKNRANKYKNN